MNHTHNQQEAPITVLMSVYNGQQYLHEAIDSILSQTFSNFIFLIIDDCSTDNTSDILQQYASSDPRIKIIRNETNIGLTASLNKGIKLINTPYTARMDADDISLPQRLELQLAYMESHPEVAVLGTAVEIFDDLNEENWRLYSPTTDPDELYRLIMTVGTTIVHSSTIIRTETLLAKHGYRTIFNCTQDYDLWLRLGEDYKIDCLPQTLLKFGKSPYSISTTKCTEQAIAHVIAMQAAEMRRKGQPDPLDSAKELSYELLLDLQKKADLTSRIIWIRLLLCRDIDDAQTKITREWLALPDENELHTHYLSIKDLWAQTIKKYPEASQSVYHQLNQYISSIENTKLNSSLLMLLQIIEIETLHFLINEQKTRISDIQNALPWRLFKHLQRFRNNIKTSFGIKKSTKG